MVGTGKPFHVPLPLASSVDTVGVPVIAGAAVNDGAPLTRSTAVEETSRTEPNVLLATAAIRRYLPASAQVGV